MNGKRLIFRFLSFSFVFLLAFGVQGQVDLDAGKKLFKNKCATCHNKDMKSKLTGPPLGIAPENWDNKEDLYSWIKNNKAMIAKGHPRALEVYNEYAKASMDLFPELADTDIDNILGYIEEVYEKGCYPCPPGDPAIASTGGQGDTSSNAWLYWMLFVVLAILAVVLMRTVANLNYAQQVVEGNAPAQRKTLVDILTSRGVVAFVVFVLIVLGGYTTVNNAIAFGRQQSYQPEQPIKFSHELHAGVHQIDCQYCHDGARRSKHAVIPAVNTCMNCHKAVTKGPKYGEKEIAKIYEAAGWDAEAQKYTKEGTPIEWNRIHNLPDHVYFNHSQHVIAGKVACETCHGKVEEMEVVEQYAPLSMGWCVNCHRETDVQFDNEYYDSYENYHKDIELGRKNSIKVEDIGGLECQKCHY